MAGFRFVLLMATAGLLSALAPAYAETPAKPADERPQPYEPVAVTLPAPLDDKSFIAFRKELAKVAKARIFADLDRLVIARGFFWDRDFKGAFDPKRSGAENLAAAIALEANHGAGWKTLAAMAGEATVAPAVARPAVICSPGEATFNEADFARLLALTKTDGRDWLHPRAEKTVVHAAPRTDSQAVDQLGLHFVRRLREKTAPTAAPADGKAWIHVATPSGRVGHVAPGELASLEPRQLCYLRDITGRWHVTGYVAAGE